MPAAWSRLSLFRFTPWSMPILYGITSLMLYEPSAQEADARRIPAEGRPLLPSQIGQDRYLGKRGMPQVRTTAILSVVVRSGPARTSVNGTLVAQPAMGYRAMTSARLAGGGWAS
jgi:hypothetical protein